MERTITVKGTGRLNIKPDLTVVSLMLKSVDRDYDRAMACSAEKLAGLQAALSQIGFEKSSLKTVNFNVSSEHESVCDKNGNYKTVFVGYACVQQLRLEFGFDTKLLSGVLSSVSGCISEPELNIRFSVKDKAAVNEALLESSAANARRKAEILTKASGVTLGALIAIHYDWAELDITSNTRYGMAEKCMRASAVADMEIVPEDIEVGDSATFIWAIE